MTWFTFTKPGLENDDNNLVLHIAHGNDMCRRSSSKVHHHQILAIKKIHHQCCMYGEDHFVTNFEVSPLHHTLHRLLNYYIAGKEEEIHHVLPL